MRIGNGGTNTRVLAAPPREIGDLDLHAHHDRLVEIGLVLDRQAAEPRAGDGLREELAFDGVVQLRRRKLLEARAQPHRRLAFELLGELDHRRAVFADLARAFVRHAIGRAPGARHLAGRAVDQPVNRLAAQTGGHIAERRELVAQQ